MKTLTFQNITLTPAKVDNQIWLSSSDLAKALGYANEKSVNNLYNANSDEFTDGMTTVIKSMTVRKTGNIVMNKRIFSLRGCHLIAMFSRTPIAKAFRVWVLDILDKEVGKPVMTTPQTTPADRQAIKNKAHDIGNCFHFAGGAREEVYNRLRIALNLASISDIAPHQLDTAHAILDQLHREARAYATFRCELDDMAQAAIIRQGRPYTPHVKKALGEIGLMVGTNPDWQALAQMVKNQMVKMA